MKNSPVLNRVTQITDAIGGLTKFTYDPNGNLLTVTDAKNQTTTYTYDSMDKLATRTDPLLRQESYAYDLNGNLKTFTDRKGQVSTYTYDPLNRRTSSLFADGSKTDFVYDAVGRLSTVTDTVTGTIAFAYDNLDRLISEMTPQGIVVYGYDVIGRRISMSMNGGTPVTYGYDTASRLTQVTQGSQTIGLGYDSAGRRTNVTYPNGVNTSYTYDNASRLLSIEHLNSTTQQLIEGLTYTYDAAGNRISFTRTGPQADLPQPVQAAYDAANEQMQFNSSTPNLTYDANGNLVSQTDANGTTTYTWDSRNRLIGISGPTTSASFTYDSLGRRISKTINGVKTDYQYDGSDIVTEINGSAVGATYLRSLNIDEPFVRKSSTNEYYQVDALGSVLALTNDAGAIEATYSYDPFGNTTISGTSINPFQYTGRENDGTGLYYYRARYYSPFIQRFLSQDPLTFPVNYPLLQALGIGDACGNKVQGEAYVLAVLSAIGRDANEFHPYVYVNNDPLLNNDPSGLGSVTECINYDVDCIGGVKYACVAKRVCRLSGSFPGGMNCYRNCLLDKYLGSDKSSTSQIVPHGTCAVCCAGGRKDCGSPGGRGAGDNAERG